MAFDFARASSLLDAPHARNDSANRVGSPSGSVIGPSILPIRARKLARRGLSPDVTGGRNVPPVSALYEARPLAFRPPFGFLPSLRVQAALIRAHFLGVCPFSAQGLDLATLAHSNCTQTMHRLVPCPQSRNRGTVALAQDYSSASIISSPSSSGAISSPISCAISRSDACWFWMCACASCSCA